ncbi:MAG: NAD-dependent epimerase/dehydratase family protein [Actinobacteria bacterium]|nr:NAD-dependent epimerase/dehydratase family protein [Actinomycetota bacterium]
MAQKRRVLITGVSRFLGLRLAKRLEADPNVEALVGVDLEDPPVQIRGLEFVRADISSPMIARVLEATKVDTIIHTNIASSPALLGGRSQMKENNVIGTMQLLAAAQRAEKVKKVLMRSSTAVYGSRSGEPSVIPEGYASRDVHLAGYGKDCAEAEQYGRDFARRRPDVDVIILRTQNVIGPTVQTTMTDYFRLPVVPTALGFDPRLQLLHEEDAVNALYAAMMNDCKGIFNIAGNGVVFLSQAVRMLGKLPAPLVLPAARTTAAALKRFGLVDFPADQLRLIMFGRVVSILRAEAAFGFHPKFSTKECLLDFRDHRLDDRAPDPSAHPVWERELFEYLKQSSTDGREMV